MTVAPPTGATIVVRRPITAKDLDRVLGHYEVGAPLSPPAPAGGTANTNCLVETLQGKFVLKRRNPKYAIPAYVEFDHRLMEHLAMSAAPTPLAIPNRDGSRWTVQDGDVYELYSFRPGVPHDRASLAQVRAAGAALGAFHRAASSFDPPSGKEWPRYDDPGQIRAGLEEMQDELQAKMSPEDWAYLQKQVSSLDCELPDAVYHSLPRHVIHGDYHPANLRFDGDAVTGVYDLDWCTVQPRARDLADGLIFFAGLRDGDVTSSDIRKLTRTWTHCPERAAAFLLAYERTGPITGHERALLPSFMRARWLHCRIIGRSKVPPQDGVTFFLDGLLEPLRSLGAANPLPEAD